MVGLSSRMNFQRSRHLADCCAIFCLSPLFILKIAHPWRFEEERFAEGTAQRNTVIRADHVNCLFFGDLKGTGLKTAFWFCGEFSRRGLLVRFCTCRDFSCLLTYSFYLWAVIYFCFEKKRKVMHCRGRKL